MSYVALFLFTKVQGQNFRMAKNVNDIKYAMQFSDKGTVIEELLASPAWYPIISIESVNHDLWHTVKRNFLKFQQQLHPKTVLGEIAQKELRNYLTKNNNRLNSKDISIVTLKIFTNWIFYETVFDNGLTELSDEMLETVYEGSLEFRKEIALKGEGCLVKKQKAIDTIVYSLSHNSKFKSMFDCNWSKPEHYSAIMQPFIISPMINVADIAVTMHKNTSTFRKANDHSPKNIDLFIDNCIQAAHPFPFLERYDKFTNTQIFIDVNNLAESEQSYMWNYSIGPRACLGRHYAREFLGKFFLTVLEHDGIDFRPNEQHVYSGRNNDKSNLFESFYQLKLLFSILCELIKKRICLKNFY